MALPPTLICGRCNQDRGVAMPLTLLIGTPTRLRTMFCPFCDEERRTGSFHVRVFQWEGQPETVLNIPHVMSL